jgi:uncharacterized protein with HEPN domain
MSSRRSDKGYLADIQDALDQIKQYVEGYTLEQFVNDRKTQDAIVRNLEIMGEAAKHVSAALKKRHPEIPWKSMAGVRDRLIHDYFGINHEIVWQILTQELPSLELNIRKVLDE